MWINPRPTLSRVGGKAYQLYRIKRWCKVPPYFVIAFENMHEISDPENQHEVVEECHNQKFDSMAVRSSASCEDSPQASFAGMFKTVLGVRPFELINAVTKVLNSVSDKRVADYCEAQGIDQNNIRMAVIVQKMINSRVSGVCFTQTQHDRNSLIIEACYGLGEALVSGKITPDSYIIDRDKLSIIKESVGYQKVMVRMPGDNGKTVYEEIPFHKRNAKKLTYDQVGAVAKKCLLIEKHLDFGAVDVEWAFEGDILYILQARPYSGG
jgi:pyruvate,water dikinase